ncbi:sodium leak channel non-selective protein-like, partial [Clarias magur]
LNSRSLQHIFIDNLSHWFLPLSILGMNAPMRSLTGMPDRMLCAVLEQFQLYFSR